MTLPWDVVAERLGIPRDMVEGEASNDYLRAEVRRVEEKIFALMLGSRVKTPDRMGRMVTYQQKLLDLALQMEATV